MRSYISSIVALTLAAFGDNGLINFAAAASSSPPTVPLSSQAPGQNREDPVAVPTIVGRHLPEFHQDVFLGIKYADKPVRFTPSVVKTSYDDVSDQDGMIDAMQYGFDCPGYGDDEDKLQELGWTKLDEDCLHLNIVRPRVERGWGDDDEDELLPVLVWIYGGGYQQGATSDPRYNMSYIIEQGASNGKPVLGVSINYRLAAFGFLDSEEIRASGNSNLGLRDQRNALKWINRNIRAFGGDPEKVTIWGESAGAYSVGAHIVGYDGDNEGLFRAAILESGGAIGPPYNGTDWYEPLYNNIAIKSGCSNSTNTLQCLRDLPFEELYSVGYEGLEWFPVVDGEFITRYPQINTMLGKFAKIPIITGTNTDEGTNFGVPGTDTDEDCVEQLQTSKRWVFSRAQAERLLTFYPNDPNVGCPYGWGNKTWPENGLQYKRYSSMAGDITMDAHRRLLADKMSKYQPNVFSYRFDEPGVNTSTTIGVGHGAEIPFVFANPDQNLSPLLPEGEDPSSSPRMSLGQLMARMWTSFAADLDPNGHGVSGTENWPKYGEGNGHEQGHKARSNFVFRADKSYIEADDYRAEGMAFINSIPR